ncbi:MAG: NAD-dependent succinate-semialdehyde dehydrogenase, partial [Burkholderiaceae bacterium]|nr:NAD-dependent succinate-semialdehyde dehydrogenase [Burkholderiaceae bacterium]
MMRHVSNPGRSILRTTALVGGIWRTSDTSFAVRNPATGELLAEVACAREQDALDAVMAAEQARRGWARAGSKERSQVLRRWAELLVENQEELARILTAEQGKTLREARAEVAYGAAYVELYADLAKQVHGEVLPNVSSDRRMLVLREPVGVCAAITPWNFPLAMLTRKVAPALAAGCTVVAKPAEQTPLTALAAASLALEAGLPPGALSVLPADAEASVAIGRVLCASPLVRHLSFTGSTEVGRILMAQCAPTVKRLKLELGGNAPFIVFDDADLDAAVEGALASKYRNAGQTCVCANRFYVQAGVHDAFVEKLSLRVSAMRVGNGADEAADLGPLIDDAATLKVAAHVDDALAKGARLHAGGRRIAQGQGRYFEPTVLSGCTADMLCAQEETFGPVAPVFRF